VKEYKKEQLHGKAMGSVETKVYIENINVENVKNVNAENINKVKAKDIGNVNVKNMFN
jgi:hypothetical protein